MLARQVLCYLNHYQPSSMTMMPATPVLERQRQEDLEFEASLCYIVRHYLKK
jgi:hypothetical protein